MYMYLQLQILNDNCTKGGDPLRCHWHWLHMHIHVANTLWTSNWND